MALKAAKTVPTVNQHDRPGGDSGRQDPDVQRHSALPAANGEMWFLLRSLCDSLRSLEQRDGRRHEDRDHH